MIFIPLRPPLTRGNRPKMKARLAELMELDEEEDIFEEVIEEGAAE